MVTSGRTLKAPTRPHTTSADIWPRCDTTRLADVRFSADVAMSLRGTTARSRHGGTRTGMLGGAGCGMARTASSTPSTPTTSLGQNFRCRPGQSSHATQAEEQDVHSLRHRYFPPSGVSSADLRARTTSSVSGWSSPSISRLTDFQVHLSLLSSILENFPNKTRLRLPCHPPSAPHPPRRPVWRSSQRPRSYASRV